MKTHDPRPGRWARLVAWTGAEGSTLPMALIRIGLVFLLWARHGAELILPRVAGPGEVALSLLFFAATAAMLVGWRTRAATALAALVVATLYFGVGAALGRTAWIHHHHYLLMAATVLCALTPCGRSLSLDRWRALVAEARGGPPAPPERGPLLGLHLMRVQLSALYLWSALDKAGPAFLGGERLEQLLGWYYLGSDVPLGTGLRIAAVAVALATVALELALALAPWWPRLRRIALPLGVVMHAAFYVVLPVATFSATVVLLYLAALDPDAVTRVVARLAPRAPDLTARR